MPDAKGRIRMGALKIVLLCLVMSSFISCSKFKKWVQGSNEVDITSEFNENDLQEEDNEEGVEVVEDEGVDEAIDRAQTASEEYNNMESEEKASGPRPSANLSGEIKEYSVQKDDTLMWISFKIYGDYLRWRELLEANPGLGPEGIQTGMKIKYQALEEEFNWKGEGKPYLILRGDTLGVISNKVYGTNKKWEGIWNNNRKMIKNPDLIFSGFVIYYLMEENVALNSQ